MARQKIASIDSTPLKDSRELAKMLTLLPEQERLKIEGIIIGISIANEHPIMIAQRRNKER